jgi:hypothetical protein
MNPADYHIEKTGFGAKPWRPILNECPDPMHWSGCHTCQVWQLEDFDHPFLGMTQITMPVGFDRKRDAVAWLESAGEPAPGLVG